ncbi:MAG: hypothetical protein ACM3X9_06980 [Bacillota bacterium]
MENFDSAKLIERIEEAKSWLDKAKDEYSKANPARGGLILNLAQAEVKNAWELSHRQFVSKNSRKPVPVNRLKYLLPVAASLILITGLVLGARAGGRFLRFPPAEKSVAQTVESRNELAVKTGKSDFQKQLALNPTAPEQTGASQTGLTQVDNSTATAPVVAAKPVNTESNSTTGRGGQETVPKKVMVKPVFQLSIDEEALTKEASHSLRNGK